jgi:hypothetical protein
MRIVAVLLLISSVLAAAPRAPACAPCCSPSAESRVMSLDDCRCDGSFGRPASPDRAVIHSRCAPLVVAAAEGPARTSVLPIAGSALARAVLAPLRVAPSSPFPRRL